MKTTIPYLDLAATIGLAVVVLSLSAGCQREGSQSADSNYGPVTNQMVNAPQDSPQDLARQRAAIEREKNRAQTEPLAPDNSRVNVRDRVDTALLPGDQGLTEADRDITEQIRKGLSTDAAYSASAQDVKIMTAQGRVTLRGQVSTQSEKDNIVSLARTIAGSDKVDDQLELKPNP
jgi:hyperosmotically inducible protein